MRRTSIDPRDTPGVEIATLRRVLSHVVPYRWQVAIVLACVVGAAALNLLAPWAIARVVDEAIPAADLPLLWILCGCMVAGPVVASLLQMVQKYTAESVGQRVMVDLRVRVYKRLHEMPFDFFAKQKPGEAVSHVLNDVQGVGGVVSGTLVELAQNAVVLATTLAFLVWLNWRLAAVCLVFLPFYVGTTRRVGRARKKLKRAMQARTSEITGTLTETLSVSGALLVKVFGRERAEVGRLKGQLDDLKRLTLEHTLVGRWFQTILGLFESIAPALVFAVGGALVVKGHIPLGTVIAFVAVLKRVYGPASRLASTHVDLKVSYACFDRIFEVMDRAPAIRNAEHRVVPAAVSGNVEFQNVSLAYDDAGDVLSRVNLTVRAGATIGIVGPSGAGKTSLTSLVMRLYDPTDGAVLLDGVDLRRIDIDALRANIAVVTQDTFLLNATVLDNLRYARPAASRHDVEEAARQAQVHEVIASLPSGYDTLVGDRGYRFSAGERQRLAIARAILKNPRILVLDEATSSLDPVSERKVQDALTPLRKGRTSFVVAHRLSTVRDADRIVVMQQGRVAETGSHDELMARGGLYAWMWRVQARDDARQQRPAAASGAFSPAPLAADWRRTLAPAQGIVT